jgi:hypothetical protein
LRYARGRKGREIRAKIRVSEKEILVRHCYPVILDNTGLANADPGLLNSISEGPLAILDFFAIKAVAVHIDGESRSVELSEKGKLGKPKQHSLLLNLPLTDKAAARSK